MENILPIHLQEILFSTSDKNESKQLSRLLKAGKIRKIATKIYSANFTDSPENIIRRNLFIILGRLFPTAVISHRSAFEFAPTSDGHIFLTYSYNKKIAFPGLTVHLLEGKGSLPEDVPFIEGLYASGRERAFLENMQVSKKQGTDSKTLKRQQVEDKLEQFIRVNGEYDVNVFRDNARTLSQQLGMEQEFVKLNKIISALLSTHPSGILTSPLAVARAFGFPYDATRLELFQTLYVSLLQKDFERFEDKNVSETAFRNFSFYESYFSNYIEGTKFEVGVAQKIIDTNTPLPSRDDGSHDILGTYFIVSNRKEMAVTPGSPEDLLKILQYRHQLLLSSRQNKMPGVFKDRNNFAGNTSFVDFNLVKGTLIKGFDFYNSLKIPFAKAIFMMFMVSEIHPFLDGNGRLARIMMNAELVKGGDSKIIIPNVFREDYLLVLRKLARQSYPEPYINAMQKVHEFSSLLAGEDREEMQNFLLSCNAFLDSNEGVLKTVR